MKYEAWYSSDLLANGDEAFINLLDVLMYWSTVRQVTVQFIEKVVIVIYLIHIVCNFRF